MRAPALSLSMSRTRRLLLVFCVLGAGALGAWWSAQNPAPAGNATALVYGTRLSPARSIGKLDLVDQTGSRFTQERLQGHWSIVYFGFTTCPMICPTTMVMLKDVARRLDTLPAGSRPQVILITVDAQTDTPEIMGRYVATFDPAFLGLSGSKGALDDAAARFSVAHSRSGDGSSFDHSSTIYLVDPAGSLTAVFTAPQTAAGIADDYRRLVGTPAEA